MAWEYEGLFDSIRGTDLAEAEDDGMLAAFWRKEDTAIRVGSMGYRTRTTKAGERLEAEVYPVFGKEKIGRLRAEKKNRTPERVQRQNVERAKRRLVLLMEANFSVWEDYALTLTYAGAQPDYAGCKKDVRNFLRKLARARERQGLSELKYIYAIGHDKDQRIHAHVIVNGGISEKEMIRMWGHGTANPYLLQSFGKGLQGMANYLYRQNEREKALGERANMKSWIPSRNLKKPLERVSDTKMSKARIRRIAYDFRNEAKEILEKTYPGYSYEGCTVYYSDVVDGVYIRCVMRKVRP